MDRVLVSLVSNIRNRTVAQYEIGDCITVYSLLSATGDI
jgi:hypothetical protein